MGALTRDIHLTPLRRIRVEEGDILKALTCLDPDFKQFGEAYFSMAKQGVAKGWRRHTQMTSNLIVPVGDVKFVFIGDDPADRREIAIGEANFARITAPPGFWMAFAGLSAGVNLVLNIASMVHSDTEVERLPLDAIAFES